MKSWLRLFSVVLVASLLAAESDSADIYKKIGDDVVLTPPTPPTSRITRVVWKQGENLALSWDAGADPDKFAHFNVIETILDYSTGALTIHNLNRNFNGDYTVGINGNSIPGSIMLHVISPVPKPSISESCNEERTVCKLTCKGNVSAEDPKPTYKWKFNNTERRAADIEITPESTADAFICELKNAVSNEISEPFANPFQERQERGKTESGESGLNINKGIIVFVSLVAVVIAIVLVHRVKAGMWFFQKDSMPWEPDFWRKTDRQGHSEPEPVNDEPENDHMMES